MSIAVITEGTSPSGCLRQPDRQALEYVLGKMSVHFTFLSRKLIEDMESGDKLFVYRAESETNKGEMADELARSISAHGNAVLLWVMLAPTPNLVGQVRWVEPDRLMWLLAKTSG